MLFNSFQFLFLLFVTFILYYLPIIKRYQIQILIISSLLFYSYDKPFLVLLLLFSILINAVASYFVLKSQKHKKLIAVLGVGANLGILMFFKYSPLVGKTFFNSTSFGDFLISIPLPIGISFFTFQGISLVVDVYSGKYLNEIVVSRSFLSHLKKTFLFKSFFPQLIAGPIVKAHDFFPQIREKRFKDINWDYSFKYLILGYFFKMVVADNLKDYTFWIAYPHFTGKSSLTLIAMLFGYSFQIFADFAGYSLIALGLANLFGYRFPENFNFPYISKTFSEFWRRWHISLSTFLKEYLYISLGGNRKGKIRTYVNLLLTMVLGGLWHGASWNYAIWGFFHGMMLAVERFARDHIQIKKVFIIDLLKTIIVFFLVSLAWILFKLPSLEHSVMYIRSMMTNLSLPDDTRIIVYIVLYSLPVIVYHGLYLASGLTLSVSKYFKENHLIYACMLILILLNSGTPGAFIYFQF